MYRYESLEHLVKYIIIIIILNPECFEAAQLI